MIITNILFNVPKKKKAFKNHKIKSCINDSNSRHFFLMINCYMVISIKQLIQPHILKIYLDFGIHTITKSSNT